MDLFTIGSGRTRGVTEAQLLAAFADDRARGEGVTLEAEGGSMLVASGEGFGPYALEYYPGERAGTHLKACDELKKDEVRAAMVDYLRGGSAWRESRAWREVEDENGGLAAAPAAVRAAAAWVLLFAGVVCVAYAASRAFFPGEPAGSAAVGPSGLIFLAVGASLALRARARGDSREGRRRSPPG